MALGSLAFQFPFWNFKKKERKHRVIKSLPVRFFSEQKGPSDNLQSRLLVLYVRTGGTERKGFPWATQRVGAGWGIWEAQNRWQNNERESERERELGGGAWGGQEGGREGSAGR